MIYYFGQPIRFVENKLIEIDVLSGYKTSSGSYLGYRTDYEDVEETVDRKYWQPSSVAVSQVGKHPGMADSFYDSSEVVKSSKVATVNASIRHPSNDIVDTTRQLQRLKKITIEVAEADIKSQLEKVEVENKPTASNSPSTPPESTIGE